MTTSLDMYLKEIAAELLHGALTHKFGPKLDDHSYRIDGQFNPKTLVSALKRYETELKSYSWLMEELLEEENRVFLKISATLTSGHISHFGSEGPRKNTENVINFYKELKGMS